MYIYIYIYIHIYIIHIYIYIVIIIIIIIIITITIVIIRLRGRRSGCPAGRRGPARRRRRNSGLRIFRVNVFIHRLLLRSSSRNCSAAPDLVLFKLIIFPGGVLISQLIVFLSGGVLLAQTPVVFVKTASSFTPRL